MGGALAIAPLFANLFLVPDALTPAAMAVYGAILLTWFFAVGASIGSFLNVVALRVPRGEGIVRPGSHCPFCKDAIKRRDNLPILGWLLLRGRCRTCGARIPARYVLVEALVGAVFVSLAVAELYFEGTASGAGAGAPRYPSPWWLWTARPESLPLFLYHALLLSLLVLLTLFAQREARVPHQVVLGGLIAGWIAALVWPPLRPVSFLFPFLDSSVDRWPATLWWARGAIDGIAGFAVGLPLGGLLDELAAGPAQTPRADDRADVARGGAALVGMYLGWQAVLSVFAIGTVLAVLAKGSRGIQSTLEGTGAAPLVFLASWIHLVTWASIVRQPWWPGSGRTPGLVLAAIVVVAAAARRFAAKSASGRRRE